MISSSGRDILTTPRATTMTLSPRLETGSSPASSTRFHGGKMTDCMVIYRAFRREVIDKLDLTSEDAYVLPERMFGTNVSWEPLMSVRAAKAKMRIAEIPAGEPARIGGERKLQVWRWGAAFLFQFVREVWFWRPKKP